MNNYEEVFNSYLLARAAAHVADDLLFDFYEQNRARMNDKSVIAELQKLENKCQVRDKAFLDAQHKFHAVIGIE